MNQAMDDDPASPRLQPCSEGCGATGRILRRSSLVSSQEADSALSQELRQLGLGLHSRSRSRESQMSGRTSFSLKDISNSRELAQAHRRTSSKLLSFCDSRQSLDPRSKSSVLVKSINQSYSHLLGSMQRSEDREGSLALLSEFPSSVYEDLRSSRPYAIDIDLRNQSEGREGSTILSNLSSDSSKVGTEEQWEKSVVYVSATSAPLAKEPLEINLFESQNVERGDFRCSASSSRLPPARKIFCPTCNSEVVPILSFQPTEETWWKRVLMLGELIRCCREVRPQHEDVVHICRKCSRELHRSRAR